MDASAGDGPRPDDYALIERLLDGDQQALRTLMDRYDRLVRYTIFKTATRYCQRDPGWLDARANEAWTGIVLSLRKDSRRRQPESISSYITQIARNKCRDAIRRARSRIIIPIEDAFQAGQAGPEPESDTTSNPADLLADLEQLDALRTCISQLNQDDRLICSEIDLILDSRWKEAAQRLQMPESTLRSRWQGVVRRLQTCLEKKT